MIRKRKARKSSVFSPPEKKFSWGSLKLETHTIIYVWGIFQSQRTLTLRFILTKTSMCISRAVIESQQY